MSCKGLFNRHKWRTVHEDYSEGKLKLVIKKCDKCGMTEISRY